MVYSRRDTAFINFFSKELVTSDIFFERAARYTTHLFRILRTVATFGLPPTRSTLASVIVRALGPYEFSPLSQLRLLIDALRLSPGHLYRRPPYAYSGFVMVPEIVIGSCGP